MNIFESIRADHDRHRNLLERLVKTSGASKERSQLYKEIKAELKVHADVEERHFYVPLINVDMTQNHARHGVHEHHEIDELIAKLDECDQDTGAWLVHAKSLQEQVEHHLEDEERTIFQLAGKVLSDEQKEQLATAYRNERDKDLAEHGIDR